MRAAILGVLAALALTANASAETDKSEKANPVPAPATGGWQIEDHTSALDGSADYTAMLYAENDIMHVRGEGTTPMLGLRCDHNGLFLMLVWPDTVEVDKLTQRVTLTWRLDDGPVQHSDWEGIRHGATQMGRSALAWARKWSAGQVLIIRVPDKHAGQEATFNLSGMALVVDHIGGLNCG